MILKLIETFFIGTLASFIGAIAGGGGLISMPFLIFIGLPPQIALATNKFGGVGLSIGGLIKFIKEKKIVWEYAILLSISGVLGSIIGSNIFLSLSASFLQKLIGISLIVLVPTIFFKKDFGINDKDILWKRKVIGSFLYFLVAILASFLGGMGGITISIVILFFGLSIVKASATELFSYSIFSFLSVIIFAFNKIIDYRIGVVLFLGMMLGGYLGAHTAIKKGNKWTKTVFAIVIILSAFKILLNI